MYNLTAYKYLINETYMSSGHLFKVPDLTILYTISFAYFNRFVISVSYESIASCKVKFSLVPFLQTKVTNLLSLHIMISVLSWKQTWTTLLLSRNKIACLVRIHFLT